jgi:glycosyltransferase involved in cell wall biosynthesis
MAVRIYDAIDRWVLHRFNAAVAVSDTVALQLRRMNVDKRRIRTIANGINTTLFSGPSTPSRPLRTKDVVVGCVARLTCEKGVHVLVQAAPAIVEAHRDVRFVVVGDGPERTALEHQARELKVADKMTFCGRVNDMPAVYRSFDLLVLPSLTEGMPLALLEGVASGLPVVATRVGAVPTLIEHESTGLLVDAGDPAELAKGISRLLDCPTLAARVASQGQALVRKRYSAAAMAREYLALYRELITHKGAA